ncbi:NAD(P)H-dependent oxidoreductase [Micromonospora sp. KC721]|uniref:NAD(P)H-dependent oxidoreductase n=1 Tax=Micromonospora sp. KC721 TaxID=2530380 RepID=UPI00104CBD9C|nr:NAD(P)H-dependent oxidoreductase [Micromonospora sp. KC721]TDB82776.1 hypothetical protein E1182_00300 [Micromonospora sp. KC721]
MTDQRSARSENRQDPLRLVVVVASVRGDRIGRVVGDWVTEQIPGDVRTQVVDLADLHLPPDSELQPGGGQPTPVSDLMAAADGFVIVTPEYNHSYPASLKRFLDWHYAEWQFKAATVVPYGVQGGLLAGEYLRPVFAELSVVTTRRMVALRAPWAHLTEGRYVAPDGEDHAVLDAVRELTWWADALRDARRRRPFGSVGDTGETADPTVSWVAAQPETVDPEAVADLAADALVVGLGTSTREAHETFQIVDHTTRVLIDRGFRILAVLDNQRVADLYDRYVRGEEVDIDSALRQAWGPWQTSEMRDALTWLRHRNASQLDDPVRVIGVSGSGMLPSDYDRVLDLIAAVAPAEVPPLRELLDVIRTAHESAEHVQRARGTHPGTPFVELARTARAIAGRLDAGAERDEAVRLLDGIVEHHANAIGVGYDVEREERAAAERILERHRRTGDRVVLWEGSAHVAAHHGVMLGSHLRKALGEQYVAVHVTFGHGLVGNVKIPAPAPESLEDLMVAAGGERTISLNGDVPAEVATRLDAPWRTRLISGVYDPDHDAEHYYDLPLAARQL